MTREIKFRAWQRNHKEMKNEVFAIDWQKAFIKTEVGEKWWNLLAYDLMQYTGLKDKNGKEIYEGDIVKFNRGNTNGIIVDDISLGDFIYIEYHEMGKNYIKEEGEIIGNIYENPELLKESN